MSEIQYDVTRLLTNRLDGDPGKPEFHYTVSGSDYRQGTIDLLVNGSEYRVRLFVEELSPRDQAWKRLSEWYSRVDNLPTTEENEVFKGLANDLKTVMPPEGELK